MIIPTPTHRERTGMPPGNRLFIKASLKRHQELPACWSIFLISFIISLHASPNSCLYLQAIICSNVFSLTRIVVKTNLRCSSSWVSFSRKTGKCLLSSSSNIQFKSIPFSYRNARYSLGINFFSPLSNVLITDYLSPDCSAAFFCFRCSVIRAIESLSKGFIMTQTI